MATSGRHEGVYCKVVTIPLLLSPHYHVNRMTSPLLPLLLAAMAAVCAAQCRVPPFDRPLTVSNPCLTGNDVFILQNLLNRRAPVNVSSCYDDATAAAVLSFQRGATCPRQCHDRTAI